MAVDTKFAKQGFLGLPPWAKGVVAVAVVGGIAFAAYKISKNIKGVSENKGNRQEDRSWNKTFEQLNSNPATKATLGVEQFKTLANQAHTAMDGYGTDEDTLKRIFWQLKNDADFAGLSAAYGIRELHPGAGIGWLAGSYKGSLSGALTSELGASYIMEINKLLASRKIKYVI
jgi:hypothetical protein